MDSKIKLACATLLFLISCQSHTQTNSNMILLDKTGIKDTYLNELPIWAKYVEDSERNTIRSFVLYSDGQMYNYNGQIQDTLIWNDWRAIDREFVDQITEVLAELDVFLKDRPSLRSKSRSSIVVQYSIQNENKIAIISKDYHSADGKFVKRIDDLVNKALAQRSKKRKQEKEESQ